MIHRQNWLDVRTYLRYTADVRQNAPESVNRFRAHLRHLLEWSDETSLTRAPRLTPAFPVYLMDHNLSPSSIKKGLETVRHFFLYARTRWPGRYRTTPAAWVDLLQPPRGARLESRLPVHQFYALEDVLKIACAPIETLRQERARAAACFLFVSGMRADAFASLPISCVDVARREIKQLPELGVRTKNRKAAITYLLDIPELLQVVERWDRRLRDLPSACLWYSPLTRDGMTLVPTHEAHIGRGDLAERDLRLVCKLAEVAYLSPHKLRHGHVVHALKQARTMAELKAISQNVMHASVTITDQIYGNLVSNDVQKIIGSLGKNDQPAVADGRLDEILRLLRQVAG